MSDSEWRARLSPEAYAVLRQGKTERPFAGEYDAYFPKQGHFKCRGCGNSLFSFGSKFDSGCGWPAFDRFVKDSVSTKRELDGRLEIKCAKCDGHLGHVFQGEQLTNTDERHCVNSISVQYDKEPLPADSVEVTVAGKRQ